MKILWVDLQKAMDNIKNWQHQGLPKSQVRKYITFFCFVNSSETFQNLCGFQELNPLRELNYQNIFNWTTLQRILIEICWGFN